VKFIAIILSYVTGNRPLTDFIIAPDDVASWTMLVVQVKHQLIVKVILSRRHPSK
jgi:hypothetical protein